MRAALYWLSGFSMFAGLLCARILPPISGDQTAGAMVILASIVMLGIARTAK